MSQGAQEADPEADLELPIRKKPGKDLTCVEKEYNRTHSKIRVYVENTIRRVKTYRIMGSGGQSNPITPVNNYANF